MVLLTAILRTFLLLISTLNLSIIADDNAQNSINIVDELESINYEILDLEVSYDLGGNLYDINLEVDDLKNELLFREYQIGTPHGGDSDWNESEQLILDAKIKLLALQEKIKLEGDWGQLRLRMIDFRGDDPGQLKLRYNYGF
ncbi:hypothetical protein CRYPA_898 [uncultured Candidatus Thioglobus sp.]|nr:hypothetical protein CRYPA_898 [uncultured Candidatus Thioglobus sp.]